MSGRLFVTGGQVVRPDGACRATLVVEDGRILNADYRGKVPAGAQVLDAREKQIIMGRYGLDGGPPRTQRELAQQCGISRSYISRIEKRALQKLGEAMERGGSSNQRGNQT